MCECVNKLEEEKVNDDDDSQGRHRRAAGLFVDATRDCLVS